MANKKKRCRQCKDYFPADSMIVRGLSSFCTEAHWFDYENERRSEGAARSSTKRRTHVKKHEDGLTEELRNRILKSDGFRCRYCGGSGNNLAIHHVVYKSDPQNKRWQDQPSNLISLHNYPCHLNIIHGDKKLYQPLCLQIIWLRETEGDRFTTIKRLERNGF